MSLTKSGCVFAVAVLLVANAAGEDGGAEKLHGTWTGKSVDQSFTLVFGPKNDVKLRVNEDTDEGTYSVDWGNNPSRLDFDLGKRGKVKTIIKLMDDSMKLENVESGSDRPERFTEKAIILKRDAAGNSGDAPNKSLVPEAQPVFTWLKVVKDGDQEKLKAVFSESIREKFDKRGWDKVLKTYEEVFKEEFGDYKLEDFAFEFAGGEEQGTVSIVHKTKKLPGLRVIKEKGDWKVNEQ